MWWSFSQPLSTGDKFVVALAILFALAVLYYIIQWFRHSRRYSDRADDHFGDCASCLGWGCFVPAGIIGVGVLLIAL